MTWPALRWWRRTAFALLAITSAAIAYQWCHVDGRPIDERFELAPVSSSDVDAAWGALPTVAVIHSALQDGELSSLPLSPFRIVRVEDGILFAGVDLLGGVRLCDYSNCEGSAVALPGKPIPDRFRTGAIPGGTWRLRHNLSNGQWLVSYAPPDDTSSPEQLVAAVLRVPVPLGVQRPPDAVVGLLGAAFLAFSVSLWNAVRVRKGWPTGEVDDVLAGAVLALVIASGLVLTWSTGRVEPAWDLEACEADHAEDWRNWPRVDMVHGLIEWSGVLFQRLEPRNAALGSFELQSAVDLSRTPPYEVEEDARVCSSHSCVHVAPPPEEEERGVFTVGLVHVPGGELWAVTFANDKDGVRAVSAPWRRVPHVELAQRVPWVPWVCLGIAGVCLLLDLFLDRRERRTRVVDVDSESRSVVPSAFRASRIVAPLVIVAGGFSLASLVGARAEAPIAVSGLVTAILGMAAAWLLRLPWRAPKAREANDRERRERRDRLVGIGAIAVSMLGLVLRGGRLATADDQPFAGTLLVRALALTALVAAAAALVTVRVRRRRRRAFLARVQAGEVPGYRVAVDGKRWTLLRERAEHDGYRAKDDVIYAMEDAP